MYKKILTVTMVMIVTLISCFAVPASAESNTDTVNNETITPYYTYTCDASASYRKISSTCIQGTSAYTIFLEGYTATLYCIIQYLYDGTWIDNVQFYKDFTETGENILAKMFINLSPGTTYRIHTKVEIRNSSGKLLEIVNVYSNSVVA